MKKTLKIFAIILIVVGLLFVTVQPAVLAANVGDITNNAMGTNTNGQQQLTDIGSKITGFIWVASIVVALIVVMITGLKFIIGSTEEKAKYKESLLPLVIGIALLVFATTIVNALFGGFSAK